MDINNAEELVRAESARALTIYPAFTSPDEALGVIRRQVSDLEAEIYKPLPLRDQKALTREAVQLSAMGLRFLIDLC